ncbi:MAG TPA: PilZ domain-containing protein [Solimonas sp.]|nr:PilZ domain-containing protein [Solimonas sp.]
MNDMFGQWLAYRDQLPFAWTLLPVEAPSVAPQVQEHNLRILGAVALLDERPVPAENEGPLQAEVERLQLKLDVVMELLGALLRHLQPLPPARPLRLSREGLCWPEEPGAPAPGQQIQIVLHLHACAPGPLQLRAEVLEPQEGETRVRFQDLGEACTQALERHVFTRHRRSVAGARSPAGRP